MANPDGPTPEKSGGDSNLSPSLIVPEWPAPANIKAVVTTRSGGVSKGDFASLNLAEHVNDDKKQVAKNRQILSSLLSVTRPVQWLDQVHGTKLVTAPAAETTPKGDALYTQTVGQACAVLTADCLPVLMCSASGDEVAVAHAGWRGLVDGVLEATVKAFACSSDELLIWLGPAISQRYFQVGPEVRLEFLARATGMGQAKSLSAAFRPCQKRDGYYRADLYQLARLRLQAQGLRNIYGGQFCTYSEQNRFYSYRRDKTTGRMATVIMMDSCE